jgi:hypothetical protein
MATVAAEQVLSWHTQGTLVPELVRIMTAGYSAAQLERFFAWLRTNTLSNTDWRRIRRLVAGDGTSSPERLRIALALFFLLVADPLVDEYERQTSPAFPRTGRPLSALLDVDAQDRFLIRVVRYMDSPTSGIWHSKTTDQTCGTFYFYEPDSVTMLSCARGAVLFAANKIHAAHLLMQQSAEIDTLRTALRACHTILAAHNEPNIAAVQSPALKRFVLELLDAMARGNTPATHPLLQLSYWGSRTMLLEDIDHRLRRAAPSSADTGVQIAADYELDPAYVGYTIWSRMDSLDVPLCVAARQAGYELIVLQAEAGRRRAVSEVLDTRPRERSFQSLLRLPLAGAADAVFDATAPEIYYPRTADYFVH